MQSELSMCLYSEYKDGRLSNETAFPVNDTLIQSMLSAKPYFTKMGGKMSVKKRKGKVHEIISSYGNTTKVYKLKYKWGKKA